MTWRRKRTRKDEARRVERIKGEAPLRFPRWLSRFSGPDLKFRPRYLRITRWTDALSRFFSRSLSSFAFVCFVSPLSSLTFTNFLILTKLKIFDFADQDITFDQEQGNRIRKSDNFKIFNSNTLIEHSILILLNGFVLMDGQIL